MYHICIIFNIYISIYNAKLNDKEYHFFRNSEFHTTCATIFYQMNYNDQIYHNTMVLYFKWCHSTRCGKILFTPVKGTTWIMVKTYVLYTSHKMHLFLNFIEIDEISVNLLHNYGKSDCHKLQKFQNFQETLTLHLMFQSMLS